MIRRIIILFNKIFPKKNLENNIKIDTEFKKEYDKLIQDAKSYYLIRSFYLNRAETYLKKNEPIDDLIVSDEYSIISELLNYIKILEGKL